MHHLVVFFSVPALPQVPVLIQLWVQMGGWEDRAQANGQCSQQQLHHGSYCKTRKQRQDQISEARFWRTQSWRSSQKHGYSTQSFSYLSQWLSSKTHSRQRSHILPPPGPNVGQQLGQTHKRSPLDPENKRIIIIKVYPRKSMLPISSSPFSCTFPNGNEARPRQWAGPVCVCAESRDRLSRRRAKKPGRHRNYYQETEKKTKTWPASGQKHHLIDGVPAFLNLFNAKRRKSNDGCHRSTNRRSQHTQPNEIQSDGCDGNKSKMLIIIAKKHYIKNVLNYRFLKRTLAGTMFMLGLKGERNIPQIILIKLPVSKT